MAELATVARPYAEAVFDLAKQSGALAPWSGLLQRLSGAVANPELKAVLDNPRVSASQKIALLGDVAGSALHAVAGSQSVTIGKNFVETLVDAGRVSLLPAISEQFDKLKNEAENSAVAVIRTAMPLTTEQRDGLAAGLKRKFGRAIQIEEKLDDGLIAGAIISVGDQVIDGSAKARLQALSVGIRA